MAEKTKQNDSNSPKPTILQKLIPFCFLFMISIIMTILLFFSWLTYRHNQNFVLPNIVSLLIAIILAFIFYRIFKKVTIKDSLFKKICVITFILLFILQVVMLYFTYFYSDWDAWHINNLADTVTNTGSISTAENSYYLSLYPNNAFLVAILSAIKSVPFFGSHYLFLLSINALLVNLAAVFTCLSIKKLISNKAALLSIFILISLIIFSPWIIIPYSDTFSVLLPILIFYIYLNRNKSPWRYFFISLFSIIGYLIKPTVIIVLFAIVFIELFSKNWLKKLFLKKSFIQKTMFFFLGIIVAFGCKILASNYINFRQDNSITPISFIHYLAMGQNDDTNGTYSQQDVDEASYGKRYEFQKFYNRIITRTPIETITFFAKKLLVNYNDGTFAWAREGSKFYDHAPEQNSKISNLLKSYFFTSQDNYKLFLQVNHAIWLFVLFGSLFTFLKPKIKEILVLELSLIGLFIFVMLFEARARYLFCYAPLFIISCTLGYEELKKRLFSKYIAIAKP